MNSDLLQPARICLLYRCGMPWAIVLGIQAYAIL